MKKQSITSIGLDDKEESSKKNNRIISLIKKPFTKVNTGLLLALSPIFVFVFANIAIISFLGLYLEGGFKLGSDAKNEINPTYNVYASKPKSIESYGVEANVVDARAEKVRLFFEKHNAPLSDHADHLVAMADKYEVDWRLVSAIGFCEGNGGKAIPEGSYNTWGWGASSYDLKNKTGNYNLGSWENAIETVTKGIKTGYIDKGLVTPEQIMVKYAPPSVEKGGPWAKCVNKYMSDIEAIK